MRSLLIFAGALLVAAPALAQTTVIGNINETSHWTVAGSPYNLTGDVTIAPQATLTIDPGVTMVASATDGLGSGVDTARVEFTVQGTLIANGTASSPIKFKGASSGASTWNGISFSVGAGASSMSYVTVSDTVNAITNSTSSALTAGNLTISNSSSGLVWKSSTGLTLAGLTESNVGTGVNWTGASGLTASQVTMMTVSTGIQWASTGTLSLANTTITYCQSYCVQVNDDGSNGATTTITQSTFSPMSTGTSVGVYIGNRVNSTITRTFMTFGHYGLQAVAGCSLTLQTSVIAGNIKGGIQVSQQLSSMISIVNNTIDGNYVGGANGGGGGILIGSVSNGNDMVIQNNIITNDYVGIALSSGSVPVLLYNDVWNNTAGNYSGLTAGLFDISANPLATTAAPALTAGNAQTASASIGATLGGSGNNTFSWSNANFPYGTVQWNISGSYSYYGSYESDGFNITAASSTIFSTSLYSYYGSSGNISTSNSSATSFTATLTENYPYDSRFYLSTLNYWGGAYTSIPSIDYHLTQTSPCIDTGDNAGAATVDMDGFAIPYDGDLNGTATADIGAYEFHTHIPPTANAGPDQTVLPGATVTYDGSGSTDADGTIVSYAWNFGDSTTGSGVYPQHTYQNNGSYTVTLTVTDNLGATATDQMVVNVTPDNGPFAVVGPNQLVAVGATVHFDGTGSNSPGGSIVGYDWNFGDGSADSNLAKTTHVYSQSGTYTVTLTVEDNRAVTASAKLLVGVGLAMFGYPTVLPGGAQTVVLGQSVTLTDQGSTSPNGAIQGYSWNFGDGTSAATGASVTHTYSKVGTYLVTETVTDIGNISGTGTTTVTVTPLPPPVAKAGGPYSAIAGDSIQFDASGSTDTSGTINAWSWNFGDNTTATIQKPTHAYTAAGTYLVQLTVTDTAGGTSTATTIANISAPTPPAANPGGPYTGVKGQNIQFDGSGSTDSDATISSYAWDFGDGNTAMTLTPLHAYASPGSYLVQLTVKDSRGLTNTGRTTANVSALVPPQVNPGGPYTGEALSAVQFDGSHSVAQEGSIASYAWSFGDGVTAATATPLHTYSSAGSYLVQLTVTDTLGASATAEATANISALNAPVANPGGPYMAIQGHQVPFDGSHSMPGQGSIATYAWDFGDGDTATTVTPIHTYASPGSFLVKLTVTDTFGATATGETTSNISPLTLPTVSTGGPYTAIQGHPVQFDGSQSMPGQGSIATYAWDFGDGTTASTATPLHTYASYGSFLVQLRVTDTFGAAATAETTANISPLATPTVSTGGPYTAIQGHVVQFDGSQSTAGQGSIATYAWDFGDGNTGNTVTPLHTYAASGSFLVQLTVTDTFGATATGHTTANISPLTSPMVSTGGPYTGIQGHQIQFNGSHSMPGQGSISSFAWSFGDGQSGTTSTPQHAYSLPGSYLVQLTVTDSFGATATAQTTANISAEMPPVANPGGPYEAMLGQAILFDGSQSTDTDNMITGYAWTFGDGGAAMGEQAQHTYASAGSFLVTLVVTNAAGVSAQESVLATVTAPSHQGPVANPGGPYSGLPNDRIQFDGSGSSDPSGTITAWTWDFGDGSTSTAEQPTHTYASPGTYLVRLTVTDNFSLNGSDTTIANIAAASPPVPNAGGPYSGVQGAVIQFNGSGSSDSDATIVSWAWAFGDGAVATTESPTHSYASSGTYLVQLTVTDSRGLSATAAATANITPLTPPVANPGGPYTAIQRQSIQFDGSRSTATEGSIASWAWDFGDGATATIEAPVHAYASPGAYLVQLTVTDSLGATNTGRTTANVAAAPTPVANPGGPYEALVGAAILFDGSQSTDPAGTIIAWHWDFGDGTLADGTQVQHTYTTAGSYLVTLTVVDGAGSSGSAAVLATVSAPTHTPPVADAGGAQTATVGQTLTFDASGSTDSDGTIVSWLWDYGDGDTDSTESAMHAYREPGSYFVRLTVTDDSGAIGQDLAVVTITAGAALPPVAAAGSSVEASVGQDIMFTGSASTDPGGSIVAYEWDFGDGSSGAGLSVVHSYAEAGTFTVTLTVVDDHGTMATSQLTATIDPLPIAVPGGNRQVSVGDQVTFNGSGSSEKGGQITSYAWDFGDGSSGKGASVTHTYTTAGVYTVTLTVTDGHGVTGSATTIVSVASVEVAKKSGCASTEGVGTAALLVALLVLRRRRERHA